jgi:hypothetical protein
VALNAYLCPRKKQLNFVFTFVPTNENRMPKDLKKNTKNKALHTKLQPRKGFKRKKEKALRLKALVTK